MIKIIKIYNNCKDKRKFFGIEKDNDDIIKLTIKDEYKTKLPGFINSMYYNEHCIWIDKLFIKQLLLNMEILMCTEKVITNEMWVYEPCIYGYKQDYDISLHKVYDGLEIYMYRDRGGSCSTNCIFLNKNKVRELFRELNNIIK